MSDEQAGPVFAALCPPTIIERFQWSIEAVGYNPEKSANFFANY